MAITALPFPEDIGSALPKAILFWKSGARKLVGQKPQVVYPLPETPVFISVVTATQNEDVLK